MNNALKKIAILEDDLVMREVVAHKLAGAGFVVKSASDGSSGFLLLEQEKPDLIVLDIMMPGMDGNEVLARLRAHPDQKLANTPVIVLSNVWDKQQILKAKEFNVAEYMIKANFTPDEILAKIQEVLERFNN